MKALLLLPALALAACATTQPGAPISSTIPIASTVCPQLSTERFDTALKAYGLAIDAVNVLVDLGVIKPKSQAALAIATGNDKVIDSFQVAEAARKACNASSYTDALSQIDAGIDAIKAALPHK